MLLLFQYEPGGVLSISLDSGEYGTDAFRQWGVSSSPESWKSVSLSGVNGATVATYGQTAEMRPDTWYFLLFRVGENGRFDTLLWERDSPSTYLLKVRGTPTGDNWAKRDWGIIIHPYHGVLKVDTYWDVQFPAGYELPDTPPVALAPLSPRHQLA